MSGKEAVGLGNNLGELRGQRHVLNVEQASIHGIGRLQLRNVPLAHPRNLLIRKPS